MIAAYKPRKVGLVVDCLHNMIIFQLSLNSIKSDLIYLDHTSHARQAPGMGYLNIASGISEMYTIMHTSFWGLH